MKKLIFNEMMMTSQTN